MESTAAAAADEHTSSAAPTIIVPGPELAHKIDLFASKLSTYEKRRADELMAKTLASQNRTKFLYVDPSHIFYPYFLQKLSEYRQNPSLRVEKKKPAAPDGATTTTTAAGEKAATTAAGSSSTTITTTPEGRVRVEGGTLEANDSAHRQLLERLETEARRYQTDPLPPLYSLNLQEGTLEVPPLVMELLSLAAQYVAKYGEKLLHEMQAKQQRTNNTSLQFLQERDPRHVVFTSLVQSYRRILDAKDEDTEERLADRYTSLAHVKGLVEDKMKYVKASLARRQAALLTDEALRARLQWSYFQVLHTFTLSDVLLDGPVPPTALSQRQAAAAAAAAARRTHATTQGVTKVEELDGDEAEDRHFLPSSSTKRFKTEADEEENDPTAAPPPVGGSSSSPSTGARPPTFVPTFMSSNLVHGTTGTTTGK